MILLLEQYLNIHPYIYGKVKDYMKVFKILIDNGADVYKVVNDKSAYDIIISNKLTEFECLKSSKSNMLNYGLKK